MKIINQVIDGVSITRITDDVYHYSFGYYSANKWVDNNRIVLVRGKSSELREFNKTAELVLVDIKNHTEQHLLSFNCSSPKHIGAGYGESYVVHRNDIYYIDAAERNGEAVEILYRLNIESGKTEEIYVGRNFYFPHITADGRYLNFEVLAENVNDNYRCVVVDTESFKTETVFEKRFEAPLQEVAHIMICPTDKDKIFFCHEGNTFYISNRLWLYEKDKGMHCIARQTLDAEGNLGDCFGHECWTADGKGLYFVKYSCSPKPPRGICYVDTEGNQTDVIYGKYPYWHVSCSPDGRYLASDTQSGEYSGVCLINKDNGEERMLVKAGTTWYHPTHPHPSFSPDSKKLIFHELYNGKNTIGIIEI